MKTHTFFFALLFSVTSYAMHPASVMVYGNLLASSTEVMLSGGRPDFQPIADVHIVVYRGDSVVYDQMSSATGHYAVMLDTPGEYRFVFSKEGYLSRTALVNTTAMSEGCDRSVIKLHGMHTMYAISEGGNEDQFAHIPMNRARYNAVNQQMEWDRDFSRRAFDRLVEAFREDLVDIETP